MNNLFPPFISAYRESYNTHAYRESYNTHAYRESYNTHAYRESYNTQHVLIRLIEEWRKNLDNNYFIGAVLIDLSNVFDCIPHDLVIAKLAAYGFDKKIICYIYSYLKSRKQCVSVDKINSTFEEIISGVPQSSIVGPIFLTSFSLTFSILYWLLRVIILQMTILFQVLLKK